VAEAAATYRQHSDLCKLCHDVGDEGAEPRGQVARGVAAHGILTARIRQRFPLSSRLKGFMNSVLTWPSTQRTSKSAGSLSRFHGRCERRESPPPAARRFAARCQGEQHAWDKMRRYCDGSLFWPTRPIVYQILPLHAWETLSSTWLASTVSRLSFALHPP